MTRIAPQSPDRRARTFALVRDLPLIAPDLRSYDHILVSCSGGKDSLACLLHLIDEGADPARIELHHHDVDGRGPPTFAMSEYWTPAIRTSPEHWRLPAGAFGDAVGAG
jgi:3'-phosphoadenosine 5'-phosphosulfate sulfotransferase (PAPS reductase)/FAD synthetase